MGLSARQVPGLPHPLRHPQQGDVHEPHASEDGDAGRCRAAGVGVDERGQQQSDHEPLAQLLKNGYQSIHIGKPFFEDLIDYITSTPIIAIVFEGEGAVEVIRRIMGTTDPTKAEPGTIRADFGSDIQHNVVHGSDSTETAKKEIELFFPEDEIYSF